MCFDGVWLSRVLFKRVSWVNVKSRARLYVKKVFFKWWFKEEACAKPRGQGLVNFGQAAAPWPRTTSRPVVMTTSRESGREGHLVAKLARPFSQATSSKFTSITTTRGVDHGSWELPWTWLGLGGLGKWGRLTASRTTGTTTSRGAPHVPFSWAWSLTGCLKLGGFW